MARISPKTTWKLAKAIKGRRKAEATKSGSAKVSKVDGSGTVWVRPTGSSTDVPVNGASVADAKVGDTVTYETGDGRLKLTGNSTDPAVGANGAKAVASAVVEEVSKPIMRKATEASDASAAAQRAAAAAKAITDAIGQFFWHDTNGAHVSTEEGNPDAAQNTIWNSLGMLFRKGVFNVLAVVTGSDPGVDIYDGTGNASSNILAAFHGSGARIGRENGYHTVVEESRFGIEYDSDKLFDVNADGTTVSIYAGGSTKAVGVKYTNAYVEGMLAWFKSGCTISNGGVLDPDGNATVYTAVLQSGSSTQYSILDGDGDEFESAAYGGVYYTTTTPVLSDRWNLDTYLTPMQEVPSAPTSIEMGGSVVRFSDGKTTLVTSGVAEGDSCTARGSQAHAEGQHTRASGRASHAEGYWTSATGSDSHAEGTRCSATGQASHAEGYYCTASGEESHASGLVSEARNARSFAHGTGVISSGVDQVVFGRTNAVDATKALIIGNGTANEDADDDDPYRSNAFTVDWDGIINAGASDTHISTTSSVRTVNHNIVHSNGVCCSVTLNVRNNAAIGNGSNMVIGTVPDGYRPAYTVYAACSAGSASGMSCYMALSTAGTVTVYNRSGASLAANSVLAATLTFAL